jgi:hypothetical protein
MSSGPLAQCATLKIVATVRHFMPYRLVNKTQWLLDVAIFDAIAGRAVMAGLDPAIHLLRKKFFAKNDGPAGQARG